MRPASRYAARRSLLPRLAVGVALGALLVAVLPALPAIASGPVKVRTGDVTIAVDHQRLVRLPIDASHAVLHWTGATNAQVSVAFGESPATLGDDEAVPVDESSPAGQAYSDVMPTGGARFARVTTDRPIASLTITAIDSRDHRPGLHIAPPIAAAAVGQPTIISRASWGADESYRLDGSGQPRFAENYFPLQKAIVHHTAGRNNDPDPEATIRAIYYDHAVLRGYGDIDYNYLIDWQGRIYEGRHSRDYGGAPITTEDLSGNEVRGSHAKEYNAGTVGIVLLGNFTSVLPPPAQRTALVNLLAWKLERHGINPLGAGAYVNPETGASTYLYNISGHRDVNATACPGSAFYATFPQLRQQVADRIASTTGASHDHTAPAALSFSPMVPDPTGATTIPFGLIFSEPVTGLDARAFTVGGTSPGWTIDSVTGKASPYTINVKPPSGGPPPEGTVTLTLAAGSVADLASNLGPLAPVTATANYIHDTTPPTVVLYQTPHRSASNSAFFDWTATFSEPVIGFTVPDVTIGGTAPASWSILRIYGQGSTYSFSTDQAPLSDGTLTVQIAAGSMTDLAGNPNAASNLVTIVVDRHAPVTSVPTVFLRTGTTLSGGSIPATVAWSASDVGPAGIASYDVARSLDGAPFRVIAGGVTGPSIWATLTPGHSYRFEVRARDRVGNLGVWRTGSTVRPALMQQTSTAVHFSGSSATSYSSAYSGGSERHLAAAGAWVSYATTARSLSFVTTVGPNRGFARVYIDGVYQTTLDLNDPVTRYRFVAFSKTWSSVGTHTIRIVSVGSPVARVDIDAFAVLR
ncbi:MAG TPA: N-acetylmuramoyl-L-alanine amidase [Candidatus Dormibacteraeota bacterium]|nr:N-acetylmuramoyl-L-alanine amidase [Candidatus Dormibacteraeota bacterium]